jgi:hypothetical protein
VTVGRVEGRGGGISWPFSPDHTLITSHLTLTFTCKKRKAKSLARVQQIKPPTIFFIGLRGLNNMVG